MNTRIAKFLIFSMILGLFVLFGIARWSLKNPTPPVDMLIKKNKMIPTLVIDFNNDKIVSEAELLSGQDAILAIRPHQSIRKDELFSAMSSLDKLDSNKDGRLDLKDPIFPYLELIFFKNNFQGRTSMTMKQAHIQAIILKNQLKEAKNQNDLAGRALMTNGSLRDIRLLMVESREND